ncbi:M56 family metallopeptidase [Tenacibaculum sp. TC6]|uniref:M56 family metallopeptidase n=1 Tax=Tenacibaculum sp. TC6 TaxID=3423223 RepID=UPI003D35D355
MIAYFIKSGICLALLLTFYHLVLEREKMHQFNRFFLLGSIAFSFMVPFYTIYIKVLPPVIHTTDTIIYDEATVVDISEPVQEINYLLIMYLIFTLMLAIRFIKNLLAIHFKIKQNQQIQKDKAVLVLVDDTISPHTFWNYIFINKEEYNSNTIETELYTHELTHALQKHTLDILIVEILHVIFWINPTFIFLKKAIKLNHEFLADNKVITTHKNTTKYQYLLLNKATWSNTYYLASNLNYLLTKKRLLMMTKRSSRTIITCKKLAIIPVLAGFILLFANRVEAKEEVLSTENSSSVSVTKLNLTKKQDSIPPTIVNSKESKYKNAKIIYTDENGNKIVKRFSQLTDKEKKLLPPPPPHSLRIKKTPTNQLINELKNEDKYAIWIDGVAVKNEVLNTYKNTDFYTYTGSLVHKNARSKRFPQQYQYQLTTKKKVAENNKQLPPPPKPKTGTYKKDGKNVYYIRKGDSTSYYDQYGQEVTKEGKIVNPEQITAKTIKHKERVNSFEKKEVQLSNPSFPEVKKEDISNIPPPPEPMSPSDYIKSHGKKDSKYFYNEKEISYNKALKLLEENKSINLQAIEKDGNTTFKLSDKPITIKS